MRSLEPFSILQNTAATLVAQESLHGSSGIDYFLGVVVSFILVVTFLQRKWIGFGMGIIFMVVLIPSWFGEGPATYRMTLSKASGAIRTETLHKGAITSIEQITRSEVVNVEMQFSRGDTRIALIRKDGTSFLPLGDVYVQSRPEKYVVFNALRQAMGQDAVSPQADQNR